MSRFSQMVAAALVTATGVGTVRIAAATFQTYPCTGAVVAVCGGFAALVGAYTLLTGAKP